MFFSIPLYYWQNKDSLNKSDMDLTSPVSRTGEVTVSESSHFLPYAAN